MISARYAWPTAIVLLVAVVPTAIHVYPEPEPLPPGVIERTLPESLGGFNYPAKGERRAGWVRETFGTDDFATRSYSSPSGTVTDLRIFVARGHDAKKLFHFPEIALSRGRASIDVRLIEIETDAGMLPARLIEFQAGEDVHRAAYALLYGERPMLHPIPFLLALVPELFVGRREPTTLIYVQGSAHPSNEAALEAELRDLLGVSYAALLEPR